MSSAGALIDHLVREQALSNLNDEGIQGLVIREIEVLTLLVHFASSLRLSKIIFNILSPQ